MSTKKKIFLISAATLLIAGGAFSIFQFTEGTDQQNAANPQTEADLRQETEQAPQIEEEPAEKTEEPAGESTIKKTVNVTISEPVNDESVNGDFRVSAVTTSNKSGTCKLTLTKGSNTVTQESAALFATNYYGCQFTVKRSSVSAGTWKLKVSFENSTHKGTSDSININVN